jgi:hypothetical protein
MLDASAAVYGLASAEEFASQQLVERLLDPAETAALPVDGGMTTS